MYRKNYFLRLQLDFPHPKIDKSDQWTENKQFRNLTQPNDRNVHQNLSPYICLWRMTCLIHDFGEKLATTAY